MKHSLSLSLSLSLAVCALSLSFSLSLSAFHVCDIFSSNMVLQREPSRAVIYGNCSAGETIEATLDGVGTYTTLCSSNLQFSVSLDPQPAGSGHTLRLSSSLSLLPLVFHNVAFGDVWLCSGQSNMQMTMNLCCMEPNNADCTEDFLDSANYKDLRVFSVELTYSDVPLTSVNSLAPYKWGVSGPSVLNGSQWSYFSATCYYFGRQVYLSLNQEVPIGLIASTWGGTPIEAWSSPDALKICDPPQSVNQSEVYPVGERVSVGVDGDGFGPKKVKEIFGSQTDQNSPSALWNAMIHPLLPLRLFGAIWYQGEANAYAPTMYACRFPSMISDWREKFGLSLPFGFVQLAAYDDVYQRIRESQMNATSLPNVFYATAVDLGDTTSPAGSIHPRRKREVGRRLGIAALQNVYGIQYDEWTGPIFTGVDVHKVNGLANYFEFEMFFDHAETLHTHGTGSCTTCCLLSPFVVRTMLGSFFRLPYSIKQNSNGQYTVVATGAVDSEVVSLEYAYEGFPQCSLYNGAGGPDDMQGFAALPFIHYFPTPSWKLIVRQSIPYNFTPGVLDLHRNRPGAPNYSILSSLESMRKGGSFEFKIRWPNFDEANIWEQTSNPVTSTVVTGYREISIAHSDNDWNGLRRSSTGNTLIDGSTPDGYWYYAVGAYSFWNFGDDFTGFPGWSYPVKQIELYVQLDDDVDWQLVFRQTFPHLFQINEFAVNEDDEGNDMFSILHRLEEFRRSDGSFRFKMYWPNEMNWWRQSSNPVSSYSVKNYLPIWIDHLENYWCGVLADGVTTAIKGTQESGEWWYAIASYEQFSGGIPAWSVVAEEVEFWARNNPPHP